MVKNLWGWVGRLSLAACGAALALTAHPAHAYTPSVVITWDQATIQAIEDVHPGPSIAARELAIVHTAIYDAWACYDTKAVGTRYGAALRRPAVEATDANKQEAVSFAAYRALLDLFPTEVNNLNAIMVNLQYDHTNTSTDRTSPIGIGNLVAAALLDYRHGDGSNQKGELNGGAPYSDYTGYTPKNGPDSISDPNHWQPLRVSNGAGGTNVQVCSAPFWGHVTPFALPYSSEFKFPVPPMYPSKEYAKLQVAVLSQSAHLDDVRKMTAEYWADGPGTQSPPGHWLVFTQWISQRDNWDLDQDVKGFFVVGNAVMDAGIACWQVKGSYDYVRPITAIHYLYAGKQVLAWGGPFQGTKMIDGGTWLPYGQELTVVVPPFSEYVSGHSTYSSTAGTALKLVTGSDKFGFVAHIPKGSSYLEPGSTPAMALTFTFPTFTSAYQDAGLSRIYSGIHFPFSNVPAQKMGKVIGKQVFDKAMTYINGTAFPVGAPGTPPTGH